MNCLSKTKPFSKEDYNTYDSKAKDLVLRACLIAGHRILRKREQYQVDLVTVDPLGTTHYHEAEVKIPWEGDWPKHWEVIRIPIRKKKLLPLSPLTFWIFSGDFKRVALVSGDSLADWMIREASNKHNKTGELFYCIPIEQVSFRLVRDIADE